MKKDKFYYSDRTTSSKLDCSKVLHREDGPAVEWSNGDKYWYINGNHHREDGPAIEYCDGYKVWYINGKRHREDGPAREWSNGSVQYWLNDKKYSKKNFDKEIEKIKKINKPKKNKYYYSDGTTSSKLDCSKVLHREDGPAVEWSNGYKAWFINGKRHIEDGPAIEWSNGTKEWWINDKLHREDGPAIEFSDGSVEYYLNSKRYYKKYNYDKAVIKLNSKKFSKENKFYYSDGTTSLRENFSKILHRKDGPAIEWSDGDKYWYINGKLHREDGPAVEYSNGNKEWFINDKFHRENGPAIEYSNGSVQYWLNDKKYSKKNFDKEIAKIKKPKKDKYYYSDGTTSTKRNYNKILHRDGDFPAIEYADGSKEWYKEGELHRLTGPALEYVDGYKEWRKEGEFHRLTGPALIYLNGEVDYYIKGKLYTKKQFDVTIKKMKKERKKTIYYYSDGTTSNRMNWSKKLHRDGDLPAIEYADGDKAWYKEGKCYRDRDLPNIEGVDGYKAWYKGNKLHRLIGPAVIYADGDVEYWIKGKKYTKEKFDIAVKKLEQKNIVKENKYYYSDGTTSSKLDDSKVIHRVDGPAIEYCDGYKAWLINGKRHREDGPAIERSDGTKFWYINDKRHRKDGPAIERSDGTKFWCINDKLHRENGPAIEYSNGDKQWYINGKLHREDGPAIEYSNGTIEYWLNDKKYSKKNFDKEIEKIKKINKPKKDKYYYSDGTTSSKRDILKSLHRVDGPAIEFSNGNKVWCINDKFHREDGPAIEHSNGTKEWLINGKCHREDKPAIECSDGHKAWYINDKRHREDGPAIEYCDGTVEYWLNDKKYSKKYFDKEIAGMKKPKEDKFYYSDGTTSSVRDYLKILQREDGPAVERSNGDKFWAINGKSHREDGPAIEYSYGTKEWWFNGKRHRKDGPAIEYSDGAKEWFINGQRHREDGPAREWGDGSVQYWLNNEKYSKEDFDKEIEKMKKPKEDKFYYSDGTTSSIYHGSKILHREDGHAYEGSNGNKVWYINGKLHREDGPTIEYSNGNVEYWLNDKCYSKEDFDKEIEKTNNTKESKYYYSDGSISNKLDKSKILHRENDLPAIECENGDKYWYIDGKMHRLHAPAAFFHHGKCMWFKNGKLHREDGPAITANGGLEEFYLEGENYTEKDFWQDVVIYWYKSDFGSYPSSVDRPDKIIHKLDGPALHLRSRKVYDENSEMYYIDNKFYTKENFYKIQTVLPEEQIKESVDLTIKKNNTALNQSINRIIARKITKSFNLIVPKKGIFENQTIKTMMLYAIASVVTGKLQNIAKEIRVDAISSVAEAGLDMIIDAAKNPIKETLIETVTESIYKSI